MISGFQSYQRLYAQNQELRRELQRMSAWKEAAVQLEQENAKLLAQNNVRLDPALTSVSGVVLTDRDLSDFIPGSGFNPFKEKPGSD